MEPKCRCDVPVSPADKSPAAARVGQTEGEAAVWRRHKVSSLPAAECSDRATAGFLHKSDTMTVVQLIPVVLLVLLGPVLISCSTIRPMDCSEIHQQNKTQSSGVYVIYRGDGIPLQVYCDMDSLGGGWTVFQRRMDGSLNFYRPWDQYRNGFGNTFGEYWLGLDNVYVMTKTRKYELLVDMEDFDGKTVYARFTSFSIGDECDGYKLKVSGFINGGAGDSLSLHNGQKFSTFDKDQDASGNNMAVLHVGAFWYYNSLYANPNGVYRWGPDSSHYYIGVEWYTWKGTTYSLKGISMKIRPVK
ncbi:hypothetical protein Q5P01_023147 [Channa striata]|uniref:Fibrinogen C-terminal domain-containing protein n=1 Tax=Channa striata TaxID=64152 RepID=A0AA88LKV3_CHASR|nr:hypothetical protein Q5P01_023147 [Channa striata]